MRSHPVSGLFALADDFRFTRRDLLITLAAAAACAALLIFRPPCLILKFFHIPCPSCGMTRAWLAALRLDFAEAFSFHPMFWSVPILYVYVLRLCRVFRSHVVNWSVLGLILAGFLANYIFTLAEFFRPI